MGTPVGATTPDPVPRVCIWWNNDKAETWMKEKGMFNTMCGSQDLGWAAEDNHCETCHRMSDEILYDDLFAQPGQSAQAGN